MWRIIGNKKDVNMEVRAEIGRLAARCGGISFGVTTHLVFAVTVWQLFFFLRDGSAPRGPFSPVRDALLALQFAVPHSLLLWPPLRARLQRWIARELYGCFFCAATCASLLVLFRFWTAADGCVWNLQGWPRGAMQGAFFASWAALFYSLSLTGLGYQTGWTPWWHWLRRQPLPKRKFTIVGAYRWLRHPIYASFLGLIWFTPHMTWDRALLTGIWTAYIFLGSHLKDERLAQSIGEAYRDYQAQVAGYPWVYIGPLGRRRKTPAFAAAAAGKGVAKDRHGQGQSRQRTT